MGVIKGLGFRVAGFRIPKIRGTIVGVPLTKDKTILGSILGSSYLRETT